MRMQGQRKKEKEKRRRRNKMAEEVSILGGSWRYFKQKNPEENLYDKMCPLTSGDGLIRLESSNRRSVAIYHFLDATVYVNGNSKRHTIAALNDEKIEEARKGLEEITGVELIPN